jgi:hypothetical protein
VSSTLEEATGSWDEGGGAGIAGAASHPRLATGEPVPSDAVPVEFEELELPFDAPDDVVRAAGVPSDGAVPRCVINRDPMGTFPCCPMCGGELRPEHAHYRCACGWRDSCCD